MAVNNMYDLYEPVLAVLQEISTGRETASKDASSLLTCMMATEYVVSLCILNKVMKVTKQLSIALQSAGNSLVAALSHVKSVKKQLNAWRNDDARFEKIARKAKKRLQTEELSVPRVVGRQTKRSNVPHTGPTDYYRKAIYLPFMDCLLSQLETRFDNHGKVVLLLCNLLPKAVQTADFKSVRKGIQLYQNLLPDDMSTIKVEFETWKIYCQEKASTVNDCLVALDMCPEAFYPNIHSLLRIYATLPVSTATPERTFSALKQVKSYLRSTMKEERLNGLALAYIHKELNVPLIVEDMVKQFASQNRRMQL